MAWRPSPKAVVLFVSFINLVNYVDRGVISGAPNQFNAFILRTLHAEQQGVWFGLLTSAFIGAYSVGCIAFGHLLNFYPPFRLLGIGMCLWVLTLMLSGSAMWLGDHPRSYWFLVLCRAASGVGEAAFQCIVPPYIEDFAPVESKSLWLAVFFTAIPVGQVRPRHALAAPATPATPSAPSSSTPPRRYPRHARHALRMLTPSALSSRGRCTFLCVSVSHPPPPTLTQALGFVYGAYVASSSLGWGGAYLLEALVVAPCAVAAFWLPAAERLRQRPLGAAPDGAPPPAETADGSTDSTDSPTSLTPTEGMSTALLGAATTVAPASPKPLYQPQLRAGVAPTLL